MIDHLIHGFAIVGFFYFLKRFYKAGKWFFNYWKDQVAEFKYNVNRKKEERQGRWNEEALQALRELFR